LNSKLTFMTGSSPRWGAIAEAIGVGFQHIVLGLPPPYPGNAARWVASELIISA